MRHVLCMCCAHNHEPRRFLKRGRGSCTNSTHFNVSDLHVAVSDVLHNASPTSLRFDAHATLCSIQLHSHTTHTHVCTCVCHKWFGKHVFCQPVRECLKISLSLSHLTFKIYPFFLTHQRNTPLRTVRLKNVTLTTSPDISLPIEMPCPSPNDMSRICCEQKTPPQ